MQEHLPERKNLRLKGWDYATPGHYFVTICTHDKKPLFGTVVHGRMVLNDAGRMVQRVWENLPRYYAGMESGEAVVMPDHFHGVVRITRQAGVGLRANPLPANVGRDQSPARTAGRDQSPARTVPDIIRNFKSYTTSQFFKSCCPCGQSPKKLWHRNYWDVIVRDEKALANIQSYIRFNPQNYEVVMQCGEPCFLGNKELLLMQKMGFLASRAGPSVHGNLPLSKGEAIISGFLSPMERKVFWAGLEHQKPLIWVKPWSLEEGLDVPAIQRALAEGRLLILSPFAEKEAPSVRRAAWCNEYVLAKCQRLVVGHLNPEGMLACILSEADPDKEIIYL